MSFMYIFIYVSPIIFDTSSPRLMLVDARYLYKMFTVVKHTHVLQHDTLRVSVPN